MCGGVRGEGGGLLEAGQAADKVGEVEEFSKSLECLEVKSSTLKMQGKRAGLLSQCSQAGTELVLAPTASAQPRMVPYAA